MSVGVHLRSVSADELERRLASTATAPLTYDHVGSTLELAAPRRRVRARRRGAGRGEAAFTSVRDGLRAWSPHAALGARLVPPSPAVVEGTTMLVVLRVGPLTVVAPTRIVRVVDEADVFGFAYGTLPGHPERGEEGFLVRRFSDGRVEVSIRLDAVPAAPLAPAAPVVRVGQEVAVRRYLAGMVAGGRYWT